MSEEEFNQLVLAWSDQGAAMTDEGIFNSISDAGDGDDWPLLAIENPDILNNDGEICSLDFEEEAGAGAVKGNKT